MKQHNMTVRFSNELAQDLAEISGALRMTKAAWIRKAIRRGIEHARVSELPLLQNPKIQDALAL